MQFAFVEQVEQHTKKNYTTWNKTKTREKAKVKGKPEYKTQKKKKTPSKTNKKISWSLELSELRYWNETKQKQISAKAICESK